MLYFSFIPSVAGRSYTIRRTRVPMLICLLPFMWHWTSGQLSWHYYIISETGIWCSFHVIFAAQDTVYSQVSWAIGCLWHCCTHSLNPNQILRMWTVWQRIWRGKKRMCRLKKSSWAREDLEYSIRKERRCVREEDREIQKLLETCWDPSGCFDTNFPVH